MAFIEGIIEWWGMRPKKNRLHVDSSSAKAMSERRGVGKSRHTQARYLWLQDRIFQKSLEIAKTPGKGNSADLVTKVQPRATISSHLARMHFECNLARLRYSFGCSYVHLKHDAAQAVQTCGTFYIPLT